MTENKSFLPEIMVPNVVSLILPALYSVIGEINKKYNLKYKVSIKVYQGGIGIYYYQYRGNRKIGFISRDKIKDNTFPTLLPKMLLEFMKNNGYSLDREERVRDD